MWPNEVQSPHCEKPCEGDGLQSVSREVRLPGVELATLAGPYDVGSIGDRGRQIKALTKRITHEGAWCRVMATYPGMDVSK